MPYTNNVPQANQTIAQTTTPIRNNFAFIEDDLKVEHIFNGDLTQAEGTHIKASMPSIALSPPLPTGTNGVYFVNDGRAFFFNGTTNYQTSAFQEVLSGTYTPTTSGDSGAFTTIATLPANVQGFIILSNTTIPAVQMGSFVTTGSNTYGFSSRMKINGISKDYPIELKNNQDTLDLSGRAYDSGFRDVAYNYKIYYRPL